MPTPRIESLLSARLFLAPQLVGDRLFFLSNLSGQLSLYAMDAAGSVPEPLLPPDIALQNPDLIGGYVFYVFPQLDQILVMIDQDGDENYQPMLIPLAGGLPVPAFDGALAAARSHCVHGYPADNRAYFVAESRQTQQYTAYQAHLDTGTLVEMGASPWGSFVDAVNAGHTRATLTDGYVVGDNVVYEWQAGVPGRRLLYGTPLEDRAPGQDVPLNNIFAGQYTPQDRGLLCITALFADTFGLGYIPLTPAGEPVPVTIAGTRHHGGGELVSLEHLRDDRYLVGYNIDGVSWLYEGRFDEAARAMQLDQVICGTGRLANGVLEAVYYDKPGDRYALAFSTATSPTQLYTIAGPTRQEIVAHTRERVLGIPDSWLAPGEDASFTSFDGLRISARLYRPAPALGYDGRRPIIYYIHGGPQGQERPNFAWFSMPLIQFLTLNGFAVFVPNVRGSTGYGLQYTKQVDHDWGGQDRLDHVQALAG
ncbi:MAG TPA: prolyl oligopeptidase family serine peptidase, partial [Chloroflexia bacterium]|nr:prolyl oligopeptidase family serine peptidase [Chloroflexia bacterium]